MCYNGFMILKGQKVRLRPITLADAPRFVKWFNDAGVIKYLQRKKGMTLAKERKWIKEMPKKAKIDKRFAIETLQAVHIGSIGLHQINSDNKHCGLGIMIGEKKCWDHGLGTDAMKTILIYAFNKLKMHRVELDVYEYNKRAIKVYKRLGFRKEGIKREHRLYKGKYYGTLHMSILDREWKKKKF